MKLETLLKFAERLSVFRQVERAVYANGTDRLDNDSKHSYHLAMWYRLLRQRWYQCEGKCSSNVSNYNFLAIKKSS